MENTVGFEKLSSNELVSVVGGSKGWNKFWKSEGKYWRGFKEGLCKYTR